MNTRRRSIRLIRQGFPDPAALDTAVSKAILTEVALGEAPETLRVHRPGAVVAFGPKDRLEPGYRAAVGSAAGLGFGAVQRLAGGRAAVFHERTIAFSWAIPHPLPRAGIRHRFEEIAALMAEAFRTLGIDARIGEVPGEYCPGEYSVSARGERKLMGVGQRVVAGAAHVGGVVVVGDTDRTRRVLAAVYRALGLPWDPATVGSLEDETPGLLWTRAEAAILDRFAARYDLVEGRLGAGTVEQAEKLVAEHSVEAIAGPPGPRHDPTAKAAPPRR